MTTTTTTAPNGQTDFGVPENGNTGLMEDITEVVDDSTDPTPAPTPAPIPDSTTVMSNGEQVNRFGSDIN